MSGELKPCPCCEHEATLDRWHDDTFGGDDVIMGQVTCLGCGLSGPAATLSEAMAAWNQRTPPKVKALVADVYCPSEGNRSFQSVFGEYVCERLGDNVVGIWLPGCNPSDDEHTTRPDFEAAAKFVQADFARRVRACLEGYDD